MSGSEGCPSEVRAALGFYEALRRLDFTPDEIFLIVAKHGTCPEPGEHLHMFVTVRRNVQEYNLDCGRTDVDAAGLVRWSLAWNTGMTTKDRTAMDDAIRLVLPILDNLERALAHAEGSPLAEGVGLVQRQFVDTLGQLDVRPFDTLGVTFSPLLHEAVTRDERGDVPAGTVTREFQRGYKRGERVLRAASVSVAVAPVQR